MKRIDTISSTRLGVLVLTGALICQVFAATQPAMAQGNQDVTVNLSVLDDLNPMLTMPRLLMPTPSGTPVRSRIVLTPPAGVNPITPRQRIVLRPPPGARPSAVNTPSMSVPPQAAAASAPPTPVTAPPRPAPTPEPAAAPARPAPMPAEDEPTEVAEMGPATEASAPANAGAIVASPSEPEDTSEQTAALPTDGTADESSTITTIPFGVGESELPPSANSSLTTLAQRLNNDENLRVQVLAYASAASDEAPSRVRRLSLSRALSVRAFLMDQGIPSTRIEVRALGDQNEGGAPDRVDAVIAER